MEHHLKTLPEYFEDVAAGRKPFEVRRDDRPFAVGDTLLLEEWDGTTYTGRTARVAVTYVLRGEYCRGGYCIMGIKPLPSRPHKESLADRLCGACGAYIPWDALNDPVSRAPKYCLECGREIDWSEEG